MDRIEIKNKIEALLPELEIDFSDKSVDMLEIVIDRNDIIAFMEIMKSDSELNFNMLSSATAVDYKTYKSSKKNHRFEAVYHLFSLEKKHRIRVKSVLNDSKPEIETLSSIWRSANWMEREAYDMFGVNYINHPNMKRVLLWEGYNGHPLRKEYPLKGNRGEMLKGIIKNNKVK